MPIADAGEPISCLYRQGVVGDRFCIAGIACVAALARPQRRRIGRGLFWLKGVALGCCDRIMPVREKIVFILRCCEETHINFGLRKDIGIDEHVDSK